MTPQVQAWMPAVLALFGSLVVVAFTAWLNTRAVIAHVDALRAEMKQGLTELEMRLTLQISNLSHRVERLEEQRGGLIRP